ncbi:hypothetical protein V502_02283 [Pseudogymnoascus sp. VKM F-4520 (FW-2644)]|nr:hypothetical protein V502_02283 [Pseudogymnoascus sp. VKM F-4520 (FW-2644)]
MKKNKPVKIFINSRIMVDVATFQEINPNYTRPSIFKSANSVELWLIGDTTSSNQIDKSVMKSSMDLDALTDEDLLICSPTVLGFSLEDKLWLEFEVADISEISWNESLFHQLAILSELKKLIEALTTFQSGGEAKHTSDDFVEGKGRGLIMLLYGPPGVGKTMTAEGLSEHLKRPLYTIKNTVRAAHALASNDGTQLWFSHLETVLDVGKEFENDFRRLGEMANMLSYA